jgi:hypothetical protein
MKFFVSLVCMLVFVSANAQKSSDPPKPTELDHSVMDMSYWPINYPYLKLSGQAKAMPVARIIYGRPLKEGRTIFGKNSKQPYGVVWRLGANEATEIEFFSNVKIGGKLITKGRYTMYCIPEQDTWTIIISSDNYVWGHFKYRNAKDVVRKTVTLDKDNDVVEAFTMYFEETRTGANLIMLWDDIKAVLPITLVK